MPTNTTQRRKHAPRKTKPVDLFGHGEGRKVTVKGTSTCPECDAKTALSFYGHADSLGVRLTRQALKNGAPCESCIDAKDLAARDQELAERRAEMREQRIERSRIPERWRAVRFELVERDDARAEAVDSALEWAQSDTPGGLLLWGAVGRGKTVIAAAAAMERLQRRRVRWLSVAKLLGDLRMPFSSPEYTRALRSIDPEASDAALVLDDLDKMKPTDHALQPLFVAIDGWMSRPLPLLVTMNRSPEELADWAGETFGEQLASRLVGYCRVAEVKGRDRRLD